MVNNKKNSERGQALVIIAAAIIGLVGMVGLAVDGGLAYSDRRQAQNAADTASYAGALTRIQMYKEYKTDPTTDIENEDEIVWSAKIAAQERAEDNGYTHNLITSTVEVYFCDEPESSCALPGDAVRSDYIQVIINSWKNTYFARAVGIPQVHNRVEAIALADVDTTGELFDGAGIVSLNPNCEPEGSFVIGGTADIVISGGGVFSNAGPCVHPESAVACSTNAGTVTICNEWDEATGICTVPGTITTAEGTFDINENCTSNMVGTTDNTGDKVEYWQGVPLLPEPSQCIIPADPSEYPTATYKADWDNPDTTDVTESIPVTILSPGYYGTFPPKKDSEDNQLQNTIVLSKGIYCVADVLKLVDQNLWLWGDEVTIWMREGFDFNIGGGTVQLTATKDDGDEDLTDDETIYSGYLLYVAPDWDGAVTSCSIEGNSDNYFVGAIFAPHCSITINGTEDTPPAGIDSQIIGYDVKITGDSLLNINYTAENNPVVVDNAQTGQFR